MSFHTTPNYLTLTRIILVPVSTGLLFAEKSAPGHYGLGAAIFFGIASLTDYFDGYIARLQQTETIYGKLLDPLADKFLVVASIIALQDLGRIHPIVVIILICRELAITGLRALASAEGVILPASRSAKWKTATQMCAIPCLMVAGIFLTLGTILLYISLCMSLWSAREYVIDFFKNLRRK